MGLIELINPEAGKVGQFLHHKKFAQTFPCNLPKWTSMSLIFCNNFILHIFHIANVFENSFGVLACVFAFQQLQTQSSSLYVNVLVLYETCSRKIRKIDDKTDVQNQSQNLSTALW